MGEIIHGDYRVWANDEMLDSVTIMSAGRAFIQAIMTKLF